MWYTRNNTEGCVLVVVLSMVLHCNRKFTLIIEQFSKKCNIWCDKGYTDKNEKQVGCYVNLDGTKTFSDT